MKKFVRVLVTVLAAMFLFTACNSFSHPADVGNASAEATGNGTMVVKKGDYIYYVNGQGSQSGDNTFGTPIKGSIMRSQLDNDNLPVDGTAEIVVPKIFYSSDTTAGIYIFGNRIYFTTPSIEKDVKGNILTTYTDVFYCDLVGKNLTKVLTVDSAGFNHRFYDIDGTVYFVYLNASNIYSVNCSSKKSTTLAEAYTNTPIFADDNFVYYTVNVEMTGEQAGNMEDFNEFDKIPVAGGDKVEIVDKNSQPLTRRYNAASTATNEADKYLEKELQVVPVAVKGGDIFFSRTEASSTAYYVMNSTGDIKYITSLSISGIIPVSYEGGIIAQYANTDTSKNYVAQFNASKSIFEGNSELSTKKILNGSFTTLYLVGDELYYFDSSKIAVVDINVGAMLGEETKYIVPESVNTSYLKPQLIEGVPYFFNTTGDYTAYTYYAYTDSDGKLQEKMIGKLSTADQEAYDAALAEEEANS